MLVKDEVERIRQLPPVVRLAGFLQKSAVVTLIGAELRHGGREDESWTEEESNRFGDAVDDTEAWWNAMSPEEKNIARQMILPTTFVSHGKWPLDVDPVINLITELSESLREVMEWIEGWDPNFTYDGMWSFTRERVNAALALALMPDTGKQEENPG